jgi:hypothetical protein
MSAFGDFLFIFLRRVELCILLSLTRLSFCTKLQYVPFLFPNKTSVTSFCKLVVLASLVMHSLRRNGIVLCEGFCKFQAPCVFLFAVPRHQLRTSSFLSCGSVSGLFHLRRRHDHMFSNAMFILLPRLVNKFEGFCRTNLTCLRLVIPARSQHVNADEHRSTATPFPSYILCHCVTFRAVTTLVSPWCDLGFSPTACTIDDVVLCANTNKRGTFTSFVCHHELFIGPW